MVLAWKMVSHDDEWIFASSPWFYFLSWIVVGGARDGNIAHQLGSSQACSRSTQNSLHSAQNFKADTMYLSYYWPLAWMGLDYN